MIDSGATSSVMPKKIVDQLGLTYETLEKGVVQPDGKAVEMVGIMRNLDLTLHCCPTFSIPMDIYIIDLPPYFFIFLSRDFKAKIGGYLSIDWSHMLFCARYGTKVTIRFEPIERDCIEHHIVNAKNEVTTILFDQEEVSATHEPKTQVDKIPDTLLDEWAAENDDITE